jgi:hypothetical protein
MMDERMKATNAQNTGVQGKTEYGQTDNGQSQR